MKAAPIGHKAKNSMLITAVRQERIQSRDLLSDHTVQKNSSVEKQSFKTEANMTRQHVKVECIKYSELLTYDVDKWDLSGVKTFLI